MHSIFFLQHKSKAAKILLAMITTCTAFALLILTTASTQAATLQNSAMQSAVHPEITQIGCTNSNLDYFKVSTATGRQICYESAGDIYPNLQGVKQFCSGSYSGYLVTDEFGRIDFPRGLCFEPGGLFTIQQIHLN